MNKIFSTSPRIECKFQTNDLNFNCFENKFKILGLTKAFEERNINSLYYDDHKFSSVADNLSGTSPRCKYRLRWYSNTNTKNYGLQFEKKVKNGILGIKKIINLYKYLDDILDDYSIKNIRKMTNIKNNLILPFYYLPQIICEYRRSYYENLDGVRLTVDRNIKFRLTNKENKLNPTNRSYLSSNSIIIELKFSEDQKQIVIPFLRELPSPSIRCSKYLLGQSKLKNYSYI